MNIDIKVKTALYNESFVSPADLATRYSTHLKSMLMSGWNKHMLRCNVREERKVLANLSDRELSDIGIDRAMALAESKRNFKDIPSNRSHRSL